MSQLPAVGVPSCVIFVLLCDIASYNAITCRSIHLVWLHESVHPNKALPLNTAHCRCRHSVLYDDGEREAMLLASEKLKWLLPPEVRFYLLCAMRL